MNESPSRTAEVVCFFRASERAAPEDARIVDDPYATHFLGRPFKLALKGLGAVGARTWPLTLGLRSVVLARHRYIDEALLKAVDEAGIERLLLLGAGYDTRAWRLDLGGIPVFEVDHPATQRRKTRLAERHLPERPDLVRVPVDFEREDLHDRLVEDGFEPGAATFVVWEGVSMYLTREAVKGTLSSLAALCGAGSRLSMDFLQFPDAHDWESTFHRASPQALSVLGEPVSFVIHPEDLEPFAQRLGWDLIDVATSADLDERYVRGAERIYGPVFTVTLERRPSATP